MNDSKLQPALFYLLTEHKIVTCHSCALYKMYQQTANDLTTRQNLHHG